MIFAAAPRTVLAALMLFVGACSSNTSSKGTGGTGSGGSVSAGGKTAGGGAAGSGALNNSGGQSNAGGATNSGGASAAGGTPGKGGESGSGGSGAGGSSAVEVDAGPRQAAYYVSPTGSDDNPGTVSAPFQTITKARDTVRTINSAMTGDIYVYLRGGDYRITSPITFEVKDSGADKYRIYYQSYPGETPVINGATKVTGWTSSSGGVYKATLDRKTKLRNLYVNDARANMTSK